MTLFLYKCKCIIFCALTGAGSPNRDYNAISGNIIQFNTGDASKTFTITINQDSICEDDPNEYFYSTLSLVSPTHRIILFPPRAVIHINDLLEAECSKLQFSNQQNGVAYVCFKLNCSTSDCGL